jgi:hypothetical protein
LKCLLDRIIQLHFFGVARQLLELELDQLTAAEAAAAAAIKKRNKRKRWKPNHELLFLNEKK